MNSKLNNTVSQKDETTAEQAVESVIARHPFLHGLQPKHLQILTQNAMRMHYEPGEFIFNEGDPANRFYLIESGEISLESHQKDRPGVPIQIIGAGDVLGWSWLFPPYYWHFDARVLQPTTAIFFYGTRLREQCDVDRDLGYELMRRVAEVVIGRLQATRKELLAVQR